MRTPFVRQQGLANVRVRVDPTTLATVCHVFRSTFVQGEIHAIVMPMAPHTQVGAPAPATPGTREMEIQPARVSIHATARRMTAAPTRDASTRGPARTLAPQRMAIDCLRVARETPWPLITAPRQTRAAAPSMLYVHPRAQAPTIALVRRVLRAMASRNAVLRVPGGLGRHLARAAPLAMVVSRYARAPSCTQLAPRARALHRPLEQPRTPRHAILSAARQREFGAAGKLGLSAIRRAVAA